MARTYRPLDGVLLFDKPLELTSNTALQKVRRLFQAEKAGHTGTLDPLATGLLPICFGEATKFSNALLDADKTYRALLRLGQTTTTGDAEGEITSENPVDVQLSDIDTVLAKFRGEIRQLPPMHSALKHQGKPLYEYIRKGETIERELRSVVIYELVLNSFSGNEMDITVRCSKGTYIRTLAEDIGAALGCGAHLIGLRRTAIAHFDLNNAYSLEQFAANDRSRTRCLFAAAGESDAGYAQTAIGCRASPAPGARATSGAGHRPAGWQDQIARTAGIHRRGDAARPPPRARQAVIRCGETGCNQYRVRLQPG